MIVFRALSAVFIIVAAFLHQCVYTHSTARNPVARLTRVDFPTIHTPSNRIHAFSSFDLTFTLQNDDSSQEIRLALTPNYDVLSPDASVSYMDQQGKVHMIEQVVREEYRIYRGRAFIRRAGHESEWFEAGWASIGLHRDGSQPVFEGTFRLDGNHHHVQTGKTWRETRVAGDPVMPADWQKNNGNQEVMVVWRDSDMVDAERGHGHQHRLGELKRDVEKGQSFKCAAHELAYNMDKSNLFYQSLSETEVEPRASKSMWTLTPPALIARNSIDSTPGGISSGVSLSSTIGSTTGCPKTRKVALVGIAVDCTYTRQFESNSLIRANIIQQMGSASQAFEDAFNITIGIQNLTISMAECPHDEPSSAPWNIDCSDSISLKDRLDKFSAWRGQISDSNAFWSLMTNCPSEGTVGLSWLGQLCRAGSEASENGTIAGANVVARTQNVEWQVIAHEAGHMFGAVHDCDSNTCSDDIAKTQGCCPLSTTACDAGGKHIMSPSAGLGISAFSPCSIGNVCSFIGLNSAELGCLNNNKNITTITGSQCGNGIVETGEECDCGGETNCGGDPCCDPSTCSLTAGSVCDPANDECCTPTCAFASKGTVCRASTGSCDPEEVCTATSAYCPADVNAADGQSCGADGAGLTCASGQCTSRDGQCRTLLAGSLGAANDTSTRSCSDQGCLVECLSALYGDTCFEMNHYFVDGTTCQGSGHCHNGNCIGGSLSKEVVDWIWTNRKWAVPILAVLGLIVLAALATAVWRCCCGSWRGRMKAPPRSRGPAQNKALLGGGGGSAFHMPHADAGIATPPPPYAPLGRAPQTIRYA